MTLLALVIAAGVLAGCSVRPPPPYVCIPAVTPEGQTVIWCQPHVAGEQH